MSCSQAIPFTPISAPDSLAAVTGRLYGNNSNGTFEINPRTFALRPTSFGVVLNVNEATNLLYARVTNGLNIVAGWTERIKKAVALSYTPGFVGVSSALNHIYIGSGRNFIQVREGNTGRLLGTIRLKSTIISSVGAAQYGARSVVYAGAVSGGNYYLYQIADNF